MGVYFFGVISGSLWNPGGLCINRKSLWTADKEFLLLVVPNLFRTKVPSSIGLAPITPDRIAAFLVLAWHVALAA